MASDNLNQKQHATETVHSRKRAVRLLLTTLTATVTGLLSSLVPQKAPGRSARSTDFSLPELQDRRQLSLRPLYSTVTRCDGFVFVSGTIAEEEGDIRRQTARVLDKIEEDLFRAGSSMEQALHVNVFLHNLRDYDGMNEIYHGRFGEYPPTRSTVACYGGIPGGSLVEIDCIAAADGEQQSRLSGSAFAGLNPSQFP